MLNGDWLSVEPSQFYWLESMSTVETSHCTAQAWILCQHILFTQLRIRLLLRRHLYDTYFFSSGHLSSSPLTVAVAPLFVTLWGIPHCQTCSRDHSWVRFGFHPSERGTGFAASTGCRLVQFNITHTSLVNAFPGWAVHTSLSKRHLSCMLGEITKSSECLEEHFCLIDLCSGEWICPFHVLGEMWFSFVLNYAGADCEVAPYLFQPLTYWTRCLKEQVSTFLFEILPEFQFILEIYFEPLQHFVSFSTWIVFSLIKMNP